MNRFNRIVDYKTQQKANAEYAEYIRNIMADKQLNWNSDVLLPLVRIVAPHYLKSKEEQKDRLTNIFWKIKEKEYEINNDKEKLEEIWHKELFTIDGETWTVERFFDYRRQHPLVFRNRKMKNNEFLENFQMAVVDMVTDYYLTKEAYARKIDQVNIVSRNYNMWKDHMAGMYMFEQYQKGLEIDSTIQTEESAISQYYNPYIDSLQNKYSDIIEINDEIFNDIELTRIQMVAYKTNAPFPILVPPFPVVTNDHKMDYGKLME